MTQRKPAANAANAKETEKPDPLPNAGQLARMIEGDDIVGTHPVAGGPMPSDPPAGIGALIAEEFRLIYSRDARGCRPADEDRLKELARKIDTQLGVVITG